jgi:hypothetical protein
MKKIIEPSDHILFDEVRKSLVRLLRDSLEWNARQMDSPRKIEAENEIMEDFLNVLDYLKIQSLRNKNINEL